jgi:hypothetical protein
MNPHIDYFPPQNKFSPPRSCAAASIAAHCAASDDCKTGRDSGTSMRELPRPHALRTKFGADNRGVVGTLHGPGSESNLGQRRRGGRADKRTARGCAPGTGCSA